MSRVQWWFGHAKHFPRISFVSAYDIYADITPSSRPLPPVGVGQAMRTFTNGIVWWGQERFLGDQFAADVIMICKHLRSVFRWHCLEVLPLWAWAGKEDGEEPPAPDAIPATEEEWEAEVRGDAHAHGDGESVCVREKDKRQREIFAALTREVNKNDP